MAGSTRTKQADQRALTRRVRSAERRQRRAQRRAAQFGSSLGLFALRATVGGTVAVHGLQHALGVLHGQGLRRTARQFDEMGLRPGVPLAALSSAAQVAGGGALMVGLATPIAGAAVSSSMTVAGWQHVRKGFFAQRGGFEYPLLLAVAGSALILTGPGRISADAITGQRFNRGWLRLAALIGAPASAVYLILRQEAEKEGDELVAQVPTAD